MEKNVVVSAVKAVRGNSQKRNFNQSFDFILNLKDLDLKNPDNHVEAFVNLHYSKGNASKICGLVGPELADQAKGVFEKVILADDFDRFTKDKKAVKKLAQEYDFFVAQGNIMTQVASKFGRVLGPRGKMPNPKAGCVVPPNANLKQLSEKLHNVVRVKAKTQLVIQVPVGKEDMKDDEVADNISTIYNTLIHNLPGEQNNIRKMFLKLTMGKPVPINDRGEVVGTEKTDNQKATKKKIVLPKKKEE